MDWDRVKGSSLMAELNEWGVLDGDASGWRSDRPDGFEAQPDHRQKLDGGRRDNQNGVGGLAWAHRRSFLKR